jgi:hypothetical protein
MATATATKEAKPARERRAPPPIHERMKTQLTTAAIRAKISKEQLEGIEKHIDKLKALLDV